MTILDKDKAQKYYEDLLELYGLEIEFEEKIRRLRLTLEMIYRDITYGEPQTFGNVFQRICFVKDKYNIDDSLQKEINGLRLFANKLIHEQVVEISDENLKLKKSFVTLCKTIYEFSGLDILPEFKSIEKEVSDFQLTEKPKNEKEFIGYLNVVVLSISDLKFSANNKKYYTIYCQNADNTDNKLNINIYEPLSENVKFMYKFCNLDIFSLNKISGKDNLYTTNQKTCIIINGDYLIDVTSVAECFIKETHTKTIKEPGLNLIKKFVFQETTPSLLTGKIINEVLDNSLSENNKSTEDIANQIIKENFWCTINLEEEEIMAIHQKVTSQLRNITILTNFLKQFKYFIEPFYISPYFGIQGRLDVLYKNESKNEINILELKSGQPPNYDLWVNNKMQVVGYNLLLSGPYGSNRKGTSAIFYSSAPENNLRNSTNNSFLNQEFLAVRNQIVSNEHLLSERDFSPLENIRNIDMTNLPGFTRDIINNFFSIYDSANALEKKYFQWFTKFIFNEIKSIKTGSDSYYDYPDAGFSSLWKTQYSQKKYDTNLIYGLEMKSYESKSGLYEFIIPDNQIVHNFREGDIGLLYPINEKNNTPIKNELFKCKIESCLNRTVFLSLRNKQLNPDEIKKNSEWILEHDIMEAGYNYQLQSLFDFLASDKKNILLGLKKPETTKFEFHSNELNKNQNKIISQALSADNYYILQGPPGTGKTSKILINILNSMLQNFERYGNIAILAFSNRAVNEITGHLLHNNIDFIRLGDDNTNKSYLLNKIIEDNDFSKIKEIINNNKLFVSTVHSYINRWKEIFKIKKINTVIVDEASQLTESHLIGILSNVDRFILIGDHKQLPAVVTQSEKFCKVDDENLNEIGLYDLRVSLFERLFETCKKKKWNESFGTLEYHYRMHDDIASLINRNYDNKLKSALPVQINSINPFSKIKNSFGKSLSQSRKIFIPTMHTTDESVGLEEAEKIKLILSNLFESYDEVISEDFIGIITPWRKQINRISKTINRLPFFDKIQLDTIERFQGSEKDIIIFSVCVYNKQQIKNFQSLSLDKITDRKLNVALSRARSNLIILGNEHVLNQSKYYKYVIDDIKKNNGYIIL